MHISFTSTTTIPPPLPSILSLKHKAGWFPTSAHPSLTWQHWGAQRLQAASAPPPRGWWRAACLLPPSGHELFLGQQSVPRSSNLSPCTLSRRRLLQSRPQAHTEYQHFLCPFLQNFPPPLTPFFFFFSCWKYCGESRARMTSQTLLQRHFQRKKLAHAMPRWQGDTDGGRHHLCQIWSKSAPGRQ